MSSFLGVLNPFAARVPASVPPPSPAPASQECTLAPASPGASASPVPAASNTAPSATPISPRTSLSLANYLLPSMGSPIPPPMQRQPSSTTTHSSCTTDSGSSSQRQAGLDVSDPASGPGLSAMPSGVVDDNDGKKAAAEKKTKKRKAPSETFVIVRPPPSNSKRPLNLQIQLVMNRGPGVKGTASRSTSASSGLSMSTSASAILPTTPDEPEDGPVESPIAVESDRTGEDTEQVVVLTQPSPLAGGSSAKSDAMRLGEATPTQASTPQSSKTPSSPGKPAIEKRARQRASTALASGMTLKVADANKYRKRSSTVAVESPVVSEDPAATRDGAASDTESTSSEPYQTISRSTSIVSSATSFMSTSTGTGRMSLNSLGYGGSASGSNKHGRRIVPMYNLAVHNVMTTVVTDAGTDTKVAKFQKRSVDISGIGSLEVVEHWSLSTNHFLTAHQQPLSAQSTRSLGHAVVDSLDGNGPTGMRGLTNGLRASMDANRLNIGAIFAGRNGTPVAAISESPSSPSTGEVRGGNTRKLLGKIFGGNSGRREGPNGPSPSKRGAIKSPVATAFSDAPSSASPVSDALAYGAPTFGTAPMLANPHASVIPPTGSRPVRYTWTIKRWAPEKGGAADGSLQPAAPGISPGEVTFDWIRGKSARRSQSAGNLKPADSDVLDARKGSTGTDTVSEGSVEPLSRRSTFDRADNPSLTPQAGRPASKARPKSMASDYGQADDGEDSDPEDSETPWTCVIRVPAGKAAISTRRASRDSEYRRVKYGPEGLLVGTMHPAPHHPRVVAQLKMPLELPTLSTGLAGIPAPGETDRSAAQIELTEENVKDCLFVTALWLVAREEIAGIGRKKRS